MKFFIDTEFNENGRTIDLISLGVVCENGQEFYRQSASVDPRLFNPWVRVNVEPQLWPCPKAISGPRHIYGPCADPNCVWATRYVIAQGLMQFVNDQSPDHHEMPEFWGEDCAYDFVAVSQLFGGINGTPGWPKSWPYFFFDIDAAAHQLHHTLRANEAPHHALTDARWIKQEWQHLSELELTSPSSLSNVTGWEKYAGREETGSVDQERETIRSVEGQGDVEVAGGGDQQRELQQVEER